MFFDILLTMSIICNCTVIFKSNNYKQFIINMRFYLERQESTVHGQSDAVDHGAAIAQ